MMAQMQTRALSQKHSCGIAGLTVTRDGSRAFGVSPDQTDGKPNGGLQLSIWEAWQVRIWCPLLKHVLLPHKK